MNQPKKPVFDDGSDARSDFRNSSRSAPRKTAQLCAQVRRALELALMGETTDEILQNLMVDEVLPAPDDRRLSVRLIVPTTEAEAGREAIQARLEAARPMLIHEVAHAITRRKCPEIHFELVRGEDA